MGIPKRNQDRLQKKPGASDYIFEKKAKYLASTLAGTRSRGCRPRREDSHDKRCALILFHFGSLGDARNKAPDHPLSGPVEDHQESPSRVLKSLDDCNLKDAAAI